MPGLTAIAALRKRHIVFLVSIVLLFGIVVYGLLPDPGMGSRNLGCDRQSGRSQAICQQLEREMQWTWTGHAIISPGWRVTFKSIARSYCAERIGPADIPALETLRQTTRDWRVESGADSLIRLVQNNDGGGSETITSIFDPANPSFILRDGCSP